MERSIKWFMKRVIEKWNKLTESVVAAEAIDSFKWR